MDLEWVHAWLVSNTTSNKQEAAHHPLQVPGQRLQVMRLVLQDHMLQWLAPSITPINPPSCLPEACVICFLSLFPPNQGPLEGWPSAAEVPNNKNMYTVRAIHRRG